jgi:hypothetical protein
MATTVMASMMSSLAFAGSGVRAGRVAPVCGVAPRRRVLQLQVVRAQAKVSIHLWSRLQNFPR